MSAPPAAPGATLAIDQGTTSTKAFRSDVQGVVEIGRRAHRQWHPNPGWVEHDAAELLANLRALIAQAGPVSRIGIANQGETVVAWDARSKQPLAPAIVWQDTRTLDAVEALRARGVEALTLARAGLPLDPYFSATKLRWLLDHVPEAASLRRQGRLRLGTSDAFFLDALTGCFATDVSTASRTSLLDLRRLGWDEALCEAFGVPLDCLPEIRPTVGDFGALPGGAMIVASVVDQQAALFGHGCTGPGDLKITFGTGGFALGLTGAAPAMQGGGGLLPTCAWRIGDGAAEYALDGGILTAGAAVDWARGVLGANVAALDAEAPEAPSAAERGVFFVPALAGLGCPHWRRDARGAWFGLSLDTTPSDLARAVLEGVALRTAELVDAFAGALGKGVTRVSIDGGMTRSRAFTRFLADVLGREIFVADGSELTGFGVLGLCDMAATGARAPREPADWTIVRPIRADMAPIRAAFGRAVART